MDPAVVLVIVSAAAAVVSAFFLRSRAPGWLVGGVLAAAGAGLGWGGMQLRANPSTGEIVLAVAVLTVLVPAHVRIVLGPLGRRSPGGEPRGRGAR